MSEMEHARERHLIVGLQKPASPMSGKIDGVLRKLAGGEDHIQVQGCGCRCDLLTGVYTLYCPAHEPKRKAKCGRPRKDLD